MRSPLLSLFHLTSISFALSHDDVASKQIYCLNAKNHGRQKGYK